LAVVPLPVSVPCPTCGASTLATVALVRTCGAVSCDRCAELIFVNGEQLASHIAAIDEAMCCLDEVISELTKPLVFTAAHISGS
jgi:hypothetical protein